MKKNILANFIGRFWSILSNFLFIPLYIHYLGFESYSLISFTLVIAGLMAVLDAGLTATLSREFSRSDNAHDEKLRIFKTIETAYLIIVALCISIIFLTSNLIAENWLIVDAFDSHRVSLFIKIISFDVGFQLLLRFYMGGLLGLEKQVRANMYQMCWGIFRNGLVIIALIFIPTLEMFFTWQTVSTILFTLLINLSLNNALRGTYVFNFGFRIERAVLTKIWRFAGGMLLISLVASLNTQMDKLMISRLLPVESLGHYTLAVSLSMGIIVLINPVAIALLPKFTALYSSAQTEVASRLFVRVSLFIAIFVFSIMSVFIFFSWDLIWIWTGNQSLADQAHSYLPILGTSVAMTSLTVIPYNIAIANGYTKLNNILGLISLIVTLPGYWYATTVYGAIGAAYVFCGVQMVSALTYIYIVNRMFIKIQRVGSFFLHHILLPFLISLSVAFGFSLIPHFMGEGRIASFIWIGTLTLFTIGILSIVLIPRSEIKGIKKIFVDFKKP